MQNFIVISALGEHDSGHLEVFAKAARDCGCNIVDSRMSVFADRFSLLVLLSGTWDAIAKIENFLPRIEQQTRLSISSQRAESRARAGEMMPYAVEVVAVDRVGIVYEITQFFSHREISVEEMHSGTYSAAHTGSRMFSLHMTIGVPIDLSIAALRGEFMDFCDQLNLDAIMEPVK